MKKKNLIKFCLVATALLAPTAHARWVTNTDDDLFSGGKKAMMIGELASSNSAIIFDCTKNNISMSYVEMDKSSESVADIPMDLVIKVDSGEAAKLDAVLSRRNVQSIQISSADAEKIKVVLKQLQNAKSKLLMGVQTKDGGNQHSVSGTVSGSTVAVNSFLKACEITL